MSVCETHLLIAQRDGVFLRAIWPQTKRVLFNDVRSRDKTRMENAVYAFIGIGEEEVLGSLCNILATQGSKDLAETFLNAGNPELHDAAVKWGRARGYDVKTIRGGGNPVCWGGMR
ncbi:MAG: hypothetical protein ACOC7K_00365 [bacterium]